MQSFPKTRRTASRLLLSAAVFGILGFLAAGFTKPDPGDLMQSARDLVPASAIVTESGLSTGHPLIVGAPSASIRFRMSDENAGDEVRDSSDVESGWNIVAHTNTRGGTLTELRRGNHRARVARFLNEEGSIIVSIDPIAFRRARVAGAISGVLVGLLVPWFVATTLRTSDQESPT
jgi:hypothetical protein